MVTGKVAKTEPTVDSADETASVRVRGGTPFPDGCALEGGRFTGTIHEVTIATSHRRGLCRVDRVRGASPGRGRRRGPIEANDARAGA